MRILPLILIAYLMCFSLNNYANRVDCHGNCNRCCYREYLSCTLLPDAVYEMKFAAVDHKGLIQFLAEKLSNSNFLGIVIGANPIVEVSKNNGNYYLTIKDRKSNNTLKNGLLLRDVCAKISSQCKLQCLN